MSDNLGIKMNGPWNVQDKWCVSPYNFADEVVKNYPHKPAKIRIRDVTMAEGQHQPGVKYTPKGMVEIAGAFVDAGITMMKQHLEDYNAIECIKAIKADVPDMWIHVTFPIYDSDKYIGDGVKHCLEMLDQFVKIGVDSVDFPGFNSWNVPHHVAEKMNKQERLDRYALMTREARSRGIEVEAAHVDATRIPWDDFYEHYDNAIKAGASHMAIYDSYGTASPDGMKYLVEKCRSTWGIPVLVHAHNDLGMPEGSEIAGVLGGATMCDCSVNGLGDRAGNACLQTVVMQLEMNYGIDTGVDMSKLLNLCRLVEGITGIDFPYIKPVSGKHVFTHESEAHAAMVLSQGMDVTFASRHEAYAPSIVGGKREIQFGGTSLSGTMIRIRLEQLGYETSEENIKKIADKIQERFLTTQDEDINLTEFDQIAAEICS